LPGVFANFVAFFAAVLRPAIFRFAIARSPEVRPTRGGSRPLGSLTRSV
jgi:hypothetical protein